MIAFSTEDTRFRLKNIRAIKKWLMAAAETEGVKNIRLQYVFCSDAKLLLLNQEYLKHDTLTDVITFDYSEGKKVAGDICISIDRVKENAVKYKTTFNAELYRVMVHGLLHLAGWKDKTKEAKSAIRRREDFHLVSAPQ